MRKISAFTRTPQNQGLLNHIGTLTKVTSYNKLVRVVGLTLFLNSSSKHMGLAMSKSTTLSIAGKKGALQMMRDAYSLASYNQQSINSSCRSLGVVQYAKVTSSKDSMSCTSLAAKFSCGSVLMQITRVGISLICPHQVTILAYGTMLATSQLVFKMTSPRASVDMKLKGLLRV